MRVLKYLIIFMVLLTGCASNVRFIQTDEYYEPAPKPDDTEIIFSHNKVIKPHTVIGVIVAELDKHARRPQLDALLIKKCREIGADGVMLVEYDTDREIYLETHYTVVGRGPWRRHVVGTRPVMEVKKTSTGIAFIFD